jgi:protein-disulfide isomerase
MAQAKAKAKTKAKAKKQQQQQQLLIIGAVAVVVTIVAVAVIILTQQRAAAEVCSITDETCFDTFAGIPLDAASEEQADRNISLASDVQEGVVRGVTEDGIPYIGSPNAPVIFAEISDFSCIHCANYAPEVERIIKDFVRNGQARFEYYPVTFVGGAVSETATRAAVCAAEQGAFWEFQSELFKIRRAESEDAYTTDRMEEVAKEMGLNEDELRRCMNSNRPRAAMVAAQQMASNLGIESTPTLIYRAVDSAAWKFFEDSDGQTKTRGSYDEVADLARSFSRDAGQ